MNYKSKSLAILLSAIGMVSCSTADLENETVNGSDVLRVTTELSTRSVITGTTFASGDTIGVFALNEDGSAYSSTSTNMPVKCDGTNWSFTNNVTHLTEKANADVYGYYPYAPSNADITKVPVDITYHYGNGKGQTDYLYGAGGSHNLTNPQANIQFKFALARITLQLTVAEGNTIDKLTIRNVNLTNNNSSAIATSGTMNAKTGEITATTNANAAINVPMSATITKAEATTVDMLVFPTSVSNGNVTLSMAFNGYVASISIPDVSWEMGRQYTYPVNVTIKENNTASIIISNPTIVPRTNTDQSALNMNGEPTGQESEPTTGEAIDLGLPSGVKWASYNVGATKPEEYGDYFAWGETKTKTEFTENTYKYYTTGYENIGSDISGTEYDVAHVQWGGNWRMPTTDNIKELTDYCSHTWTTVNGIYGQKFTSKKNDNSIFLPAAGFRNGTSLYDAGTNGYYWSSALYSSDESYAYSLYFYSSNIGPSGYSTRYDGFSVRPVSN